MTHEFHECGNQLSFRVTVVTTVLLTNDKHDSDTRSITHDTRTTGARTITQDKRTNT